MSLIFEIKGALPEHAIRAIVREAETQMAPSADAKALLVTTAQAYLAHEFAFTVHDAIVAAQELAESIGVDPDFAPLGIGDVAASLLSHNGDVNVVAMAFARAAVEEKPVLPMNRGKWLAKLGIVKAHIEAVGSPSAAPGSAAWREQRLALWRQTRSEEEAQHMVAAEIAALASLSGAPDAAREAIAPPEEVVRHNAALLFADTSAQVAAIEAPDVTDPEMREMLSYAPLPVAEVPAGPLAAAAPSVAAPPTAPTQGASSAAPGSPPPPTGSVRDAFLLVEQACRVDDVEIAKRLGISRSTIHNHMSGRTGRVKCNQAQARVMAAECDRRVALLRQAAEIFSLVRD